MFTKTSSEDWYAEVKNEFAKTGLYNRKILK